MRASRTAAALPWPFVSSATSAATSTVTSPAAPGVTRTVHTLPALAPVAAVNLDAVPLPMAMSPSTNPVTASLKLTVTVNGPTTSAGALLVSVTVGAFVSTATANDAAS